MRFLVVHVLSWYTSRTTMLGWTKDPVDLIAWPCSVSRMEKAVVIREAAHTYSSARKLVPRAILKLALMAFE